MRYNPTLALASALLLFRLSAVVTATQLVLGNPDILRLISSWALVSISQPLTGKLSLRISRSGTNFDSAASVTFANGSVHDIIKVEGSIAYRETMRKFSLDSSAHPT